MIYTKSLFVDFCQSPQLARRAVHDKKGVYQTIMEHKYGGMDGLAIGEEVEQAVLNTLGKRTVVQVDTNTLDFKNRHRSYHDSTKSVIDQKPDVIYQAGFFIQNLFCKSDLLVMNENSTYDLREVKAKNRVRKQTPGGGLRAGLAPDVSFQHALLRGALGPLYSGNCFLVHLNKEYEKCGTIDFTQLLHRDDVTKNLLSDTKMKELLEEMDLCMHLSKKKLDERYPYTGGNYMIYHGKQAPKGSLYNVPGLRTIPPDLYQQGKTLIEDLTEQDIERFHDNNDNETKTTKYLRLWQQSTQTIINTESIRHILGGLPYPLYFYDYETVATPVPLVDGTHPRQPIVVQYSCHKMDTDGTIDHRADLIKHGENDNARIIANLMNDLDRGNGGTYIVRYKNFEIGRNREMANLFPLYTPYFTAINKKTFDLMNIFSQLHYFDRAFGGSASLKKVLPVISELDYDALSISNGGQATQLLAQLLQGKGEKADREQSRKNLFDYCAQDTRAMVLIYRTLIRAVQKKGLWA